MKKILLIIAVFFCFGFQPVSCGQVEPTGEPVDDCIIEKGGRISFVDVGFIETDWLSEALKITPIAVGKELLLGLYPGHWKSIKMSAKNIALYANGLILYASRYLHLTTYLADILIKADGDLYLSTTDAAGNNVIMSLPLLKDGANKENYTLWIDENGYIRGAK